VNLLGALAGLIFVTIIILPLIMLAGVVFWELLPWIIGGGVIVAILLKSKD